MSQLAVSAAGAAIGTVAFGNPALGWAIGSVVGGLLFAPDGEQRQGPRLEDLTVQASTYGQPLPRTWGVFRAAGNLIWTTGLTETEHETEHGKGGASATTTTYTYSASFAVSFGQGPVAAIRRLWADGKLIYDVSDDTSVETALATLEAAEAMRFYTGSEAQGRDPLIEATEGTDNTPAYRGQAYVVFQAMQLADFGNRIPNLTAEIVGAGQTTVNLIDSGDYADQIIYGNPVLPRTLQLMDRAGMVHVTMNEWSNSYADTTVSYWRIAPDGIAERRYRFEVYKSLVPMAGSSDEPAFGVFDTNTRDMRVYILGPDHVEFERFYQLPTDIVPSSHSQRIEIRNRRMYFFEYAFLFDRPTYVLLADLDLPETGINVVLEWPDGDPDGELYMIAPGEGAIYGLTDADKLITWDLDFNIVETLSFTPETEEYIDYDGSRTNTVLFCPRDDDLYILSRQWMHHIRGNTYLGAELISGLYPSGQYLGYAIAGNMLATFELSASWTSFDLDRYRLDAVTDTSQSLEDVMADLLDESGLGAVDRDLTALAGVVVDGFARTHPMTIRAAIEALQRIHHFDLVETDWLYRARLRGDTTPDMVLVEKDLGAGGGERLSHSRTEEMELPRMVTIDYRCAARDHQVNHQYAARTVTEARTVHKLSAPAVIADDRARQIAETLLHDAWTARDRYEPRLPPKCVVLDPADLIRIDRENGDSYFLRVTDCGYVPGGVVALKAVTEQPAIYSQSAPGAAAPIPVKAIPWKGPSEIVLLDLPALRDADNDAGIYVAARGFAQSWRGCQLFVSADAGASYSAREYVGTRAEQGYADGVLASGPSTVWDEANTLAVRTAAALSSTSEANVLNGVANQLAIGEHGRWEIVGFQDASDNGDGTWDCTRLLRGRRGTEHAIANHVDGDRVVFLSASSLRRVTLQLAERGAERYYKPVTLGATLDLTAATAFTGDAEALKPYSPVEIDGDRDGSDNLTVTWTRRSRLGGEWTDYVDAPLGEDSEEYEVDILDGGNVVRTIAGLGAPNASYTAAEQTTDLGAPASAIDVRVYQLSAQVGRGHPGEATV